MKMTERSARWMDTVVARCEANTGRPLPAWAALAKKARAKDAKQARAWAKGQGLSTVYQTAIVETLFPGGDDDDALVDAQYAGPKAALRPVYDALVEAVRAFGSDVQVMPRKSQVTFTRETTFAVVRAATKTRVDVALKLHGDGPTSRLVADPMAAKSDPSHVVAVSATGDVDTELVAWLRKAYDRAGASRK
jgi:predicted transport protein